MSVYGRKGTIKTYKGVSGGTGTKDPPPNKQRQGSGREKRERERQKKEEKVKRNSLFRYGAAGGMVGATEGDEPEEESGRA